MSVAAADAFAADVLARSAPLRFGIARSSAAIDAACRLRCAVVIHRAWGSADDFPGGVERDDFDERALHVVAWHGGSVVGTTRLVTPEPDQRLPTEAAFDLDIASRGSVIDVGRTCRAPGFRDPGQRVVWGLLCQAWLEARARGCAEICGIFSPAMLRFYRRLGFRIEVLAGPREHWHESRYAVLLRPAEWINGV